MLVYARYRGCPADPWFSGVLRPLDKPRVSLDRGRRGTCKCRCIRKILDPFFRSLCRGCAFWTLDDGCLGNLPPSPLPYACNTWYSWANLVGCRLQRGFQDPFRGEEGGQDVGEVHTYSLYARGKVDVSRYDALLEVYIATPTSVVGRHRRRLHKFWRGSTPQGLP